MTRRGVRADRVISACLSGRKQAWSQGGCQKSHQLQNFIDIHSGIGSAEHTGQLRNRNSMCHSAQLYITRIHFLCKHCNPHQTKCDRDCIGQAPGACIWVCDSDYRGYHAQTCFPMVYSISRLGMALWTETYQRTEVRLTAPTQSRMSSVLEGFAGYHSDN